MSRTYINSGPNGALIKEIVDMHPNAPFIHRQGEVDAWDNSDFRAAVQATGKKQVILAGITTDVSIHCPSFRLSRPHHFIGLHRVLGLVLARRWVQCLGQ